MLALLKSRLVGALLLLLLMASMATAGPADAPLPERLVTPPPRHEAAPHPVPHPLSRQEIFQAVQKHLAQEGNTRRGNLRPQDLIIQTSMPIVGGDAGLEIRKISFDRLRGETVFELWTSHQPQYLPFHIATRRDPKLWGAHLPGTDPEKRRQEFRGGSHRTGAAASVGPANLPVLVKPGSAATLELLGENMRITFTVMPLQPGAKGQCILVRDAVTARVMKAVVVSAGLLQAAL